MTIIESRLIVRVYTSQGVEVRTNRRPGETKHHTEMEDTERERLKEKKRLEAQAKRNRDYAAKHKEW